VKDNIPFNGSPKWRLTRPRIRVPAPSLRRPPPWDAPERAVPVAGAHGHGRERDRLIYSEKTYPQTRCWRRAFGTTALCGLPLLLYNFPCLFELKLFDLSMACSCREELENCIWTQSSSIHDVALLFFLFLSCPFYAIFV
jgi:hypothetical protein